MDGRMSEYGYVCVSNSKKAFVGRIIKFVTRSNFSHSFITVPDMLGERMVMEAAANGVSVVPFNKAYRVDPDEGYRIYRFKADPAAKDAAILTIAQSLETGYGFLELPWFIWRAVNRLFGRDIRGQNNWSDAGTICSELAAQYISMSGFSHLFEDFGRCSVNAQDIFEICKANPELFELIEVKE
jgi:hypothetical protein